MLKANQQARANLGQGVDGEALAQVSLPKRGVDVVHQREQVLAQRACLALAVFECGLQAFLLVDFGKVLHTMHETNLVESIHKN